MDLETETPARQRRGSETDSRRILPFPPRPTALSPAEVLARRPSLQERLSGEPWVFDQGNLTLALRDSSGEDVYELDLEELRTSPKVLDVICHVAGKRWATREVIGSLVRSLNEILRPQATLCGLGLERGPIDVRRLLERPA